MKKLLLPILMLSTLLIACDSAEDVQPPYLYDIRLQFVDTTGNNLLDKMNLVDVTKNLEVSIADKATDFGFEFDTIQNEKYLLLSLGVFSKKDITSQIVIKMTNSNLFGDESQHIINTEWEFLNGISRYWSKVSLDGTPFEVIDKSPNPPSPFRVADLVID